MTPASRDTRDTDGNPERRVRVGMLGGTFDPPHNAHLALAEAARATLALDRIVFVPAGDPWRKRSRSVTPAAVRLEMVRAATHALPWASVSTVEVDREGPSYTAETLAELIQPDEDWWFVLGADALADMPHWQHPERILELARLAVAHRPDAATDLPPVEVTRALPAIVDRIDLVEMRPLDISATEIRRRLAAGESTDDLLPHPVRDVIDRLGLYR